MIALIRFQLRYRWKVWLFSTLLCGMLIALYLMPSSGDFPFSLFIPCLYSSLIESFGAKRADEAYIPRLALPIGKRSYIGYIAIRNAAFYAICGLVAAIIAAVICLVAGFPLAQLGRVPFIIVVLAAYSSLCLVADSLVGMKGWQWVLLVFSVLWLFLTPPFDSVLAGSPLTGSIEASLKAGYGWSLAACAEHPGRALGLALAIASLSAAFALARVKRIRF